MYFFVNVYTCIILISNKSLGCFYIIVKSSQAYVEDITVCIQMFVFNLSAVYTIYKMMLEFVSCC